KHGVAFATEAKGKEASEEDQLDTILSMLRHPCTLNELADAVDRSPSTVEKWLAQLRSEGYNVIDAGSYYSLTKSAAPAEAAVDHRQDSTRRTIAIVSDTHLGSKYQQLTHLR